MNDRTRKLLESVGTTQSRRRRRDRGKQDAVDAVLESARGARPSDEMDSMQGVDVQVDDTDKDAPVAANLEKGPGALDGVDVQLDVGDEEGNMNAAAEVGDAEIPDLDFEEVKAAGEKAGLKVDLEADTSMDALKRGAKVELEHTNDPLIAAAIASSHIAEFPDYYDALEKMEDELKSKGTDENPIEPPSEEPMGEPDEDDYEEIEIGEFGGSDKDEEGEEEDDEEEEDEEDEE
jgi:hypothetical protein